MSEYDLAPETSLGRQRAIQLRVMLALMIPVMLLSAFAVVYSTGSNVILFIWLNHWMHQLPVEFWANVTFLADSAAIMGIAGVCLLRKERLVLAAIVGGIVCGVLIRVLKIGFDMPRPPAVLNGSLFETIGEAYRSKSFPSGHAATAFFVGGLILSFWQNRSAYALAVAFSILGALSRVAAGVHWPADILVGGAIGWFIGYSAGVLFKKRAYFSYPKRILVFAISYVSAVFLLVYDPNMPHVLWAQGLIAGAGLYCSLFYLAFRILKV